MLPLIRVRKDIIEFEFWFYLDLENYFDADNPIKNVRFL